MSGEVRRWRTLDNGFGIEDCAGNYVLHSDYADLLARYEAVARDAARYLWLVETDSVPDDVNFAVFMRDKDQADAAIDHAMQDDGRGDA